MASHSLVRPHAIRGPAALGLLDISPAFAVAHSLMAGRQQRSLAFACVAPVSLYCCCLLAVLLFFFYCWTGDRRHGSIAQVDYSDRSRLFIPGLSDRSEQAFPLTLLSCPIFCPPPMIAHASPRLIMASQARMSKATVLMTAPFHFHLRVIE